MSEDYLFSLIFGGVFTIVGLTFLSTGINFFSEKRKKVKNCTEFATATIIDIVKERVRTSSGRSSACFAPIYEYYDGTRQVRVQRDYLASYNSCGQIGDSAELYYNPENTTDILLPGDKGSDVFTVVFSLLGAICSCIGVIILGSFLYNLLF